MDPQQPFASPQNVTSFISSNSIHYILTGSFRSLSLVLLAFSPLARTLTWVKTIPGDSGPHQFLAKVKYGDGCGSGLFEASGTGDSGGWERGAGKKWSVYGTSWAIPPMLHSWGLIREADGWRVWNVGQTPISKPPYLNL
jgi:carboxy-cis,cis-muconate cyclase